MIGKPVSQARALIRRFKTMMGIEGYEPQPGDEDVAMGDLEALQGVVKFPVRIKCAVLGWNTLADALAANVSSTASPNFRIAIVSPRSTVNETPLTARATPSRVAPHAGGRSNDARTAME